MSLPKAGIVGDSYKTEELSRKFMDKILRLGNLYFYYHAFKPVSDFSKICQAGKYNFPELTEYTRRVLQAVEDSGGSVEIDGLDNLVSEPRVFVANHMSSRNSKFSLCNEKCGPIYFCD